MTKKTPQKVAREGTYLNIIKGTYNKPTASIILSGEKLIAISFSLCLCPVFPKTTQVIIPAFMKLFSVYLPFLAWGYTLKDIFQFCFVLI